MWISVLSTISLKAIPISIVNYAVGLNHICDPNLIRNWALGNSCSLLRGWCSLPLQNPHYFLISSTLPLLRDIIAGTHCPEAQAIDGDFACLVPTNMPVEKKVEKCLLMKDIMPVPSTVQKITHQHFVVMNILSQWCCQGPLKIQVICCTTWVSQPFPGTLPNSKFLGWGKKTIPGDCTEGPRFRKVLKC